MERIKKCWLGWLLFLAGSLQAQEYNLLEEPLHNVLVVKYSFDGKILATGGDGEKKLVLWDAENHKKKYVIEGNEGYVLSLAFSRSGSLLASGDVDGKIIVSQVATGYKDKVFTGHTGAVTSLVFSRDGRCLISGSADKTISVWDMLKNSKVREIKDHKKEVSALAISDNGLWLASGSFSGEILIYNTQTWEIADKIIPKGGKVRSLAFSKNGKTLAAGFDDKIIRVYNLETKLLTFILRGHKNSVYDVKFSPDDIYLASAGLDNKIWMWSMETGEKIKSFSGFYNLVSVDFNPNGKWLCSSDMDTKIRLWDVSSFKIIPAKPPLIGDMAASGAKPKIEMVQPQVAFGKTFVWTEKTITLKGHIKSEAGIYELHINDREVPIVGDNGFSLPMMLSYNDNIIKIKVIDKNGIQTEESFIIQRQTKIEGVIDNADTIRRTDYALIITTNEYDNYNHLSNPVNDGATIARELEEKYKFKTKIINNPVRKDLYNAIRDYSKKQFTDDDQLFIFIAGHGEFDHVFSEGYLVTKDSKANDEVKESFISHSNLRTIINNIPCKHILLVMDVCFGGTFDQFVAKQRGATSGEDDIEKSKFIQRKLQYTTRKYITSGGKEYVPDGRPGAHSPFARKLLDALRSFGGDDGIITFNELFGYVEKAVPGPKAGEFGNNQPGSDFLFIYNK